MLKNHASPRTLTGAVLALVLMGSLAGCSVTKVSSGGGPSATPAATSAAPVDAEAGAAEPEQARDCIRLGAGFMKTSSKLDTLGENGDPKEYLATVKALGEDVATELADVTAPSVREVGDAVVKSITEISEYIDLVLNSGAGNEAGLQQRLDAFEQAATDFQELCEIK